MPLPKGKQYNQLVDSLSMPGGHEIRSTINFEGDELTAKKEKVPGTNFELNNLSYLSGKEVPFL
jgi:hypothetical protein